MNDLQSLIEDIQAVLAADTDAAPARIQSLETDYAAAVTGVNERLRECERLLRSGHHAEAIQRCEVEPNLLDQVAMLDFAEAAQWGDYAIQFGVAAPPRLCVELAGELNEAYTAIEPFKHLLRRHRLHALGRSPLSVRIGILRKIAEMDASNPIWDEDLRSYERARIGQIAQELSLCIQQRAVDRIALLDQELRSPAWRERPSKALISQTTDASRRLQAGQARVALEGVVENLCNTFAAFDVPAGRAIRDRFNELQEVAQLSAGDRLFDLAGPALDWLRQQDMRASQEQEHQAVLARLSAEVQDEDADRDELVRLLGSAQRDEREVPADLDARVVERIQAIDRAAVRKSRLAIAGTAIGIIVAGSLVGTAIVWHQKSIHVRQTVERIATLIHENNLAGAVSAVHELEQKSPRILAAPEVQSQVADLNKLLKEDEEHGIARLSERKAAEETLKSLDWSTLDDANKHVKLLRELSRTEAENRDADELEQSLKNELQKLEVRETRKVGGQLNDLRKQFDAARGDAPKLQDLLDQAHQDVDQNPHMDAASQTQFKALGEQITHEMAKLQQDDQRLTLLTSITKQIGDTELYRDALRAYAQAFPNERRSKEFLTVAGKEATFLRAVKNWNNVIDDWSRDFRSVSPSQANLLLTEAQEPFQEMPFHPAAKEVKRYRTVLELLLAPARPEGLKKINEILHDHDIEEYYYVREGVAKRYYCLAKPVESNDRCSFFFVKNSEEKKTFPKALDRKTVTKRNDDWESPQLLFARNALKGIEGLPSSGWEQTFYDVLSDLTGDQDIDPILKLILLRSMIPPIRAGSLFFQENLKEMEDKLQEVELGIPSANWCDPVDPDVNKARERVQQQLGRLAKMKSFEEPLKKYREWLSKRSFGPKYKWSGYLYRRPADSKWACALDPKLRPADPRPLFTIISAADGSLEFAKFASVDDLNNLKVQPPEGRAVFFEIDGAKK